MNNSAQEILTYEIYELEDSIYHISIPVQNLINPKFMIVDKNDLIILLDDYAKSYAVKNIPDYILESIKNRKCFLIENLDLSSKNQHMICLAC